MPSQPFLHRGPRIAILGAGPVGLTLAAILHRHDVPFRLFDRDDGGAGRSGGRAFGPADLGGTLDLHADAGQRALRAAGLLGRFLEVARRGAAEETRLFGADGRAVDVEAVLAARGAGGAGPAPPADAGGEVEGRPEIDRTALRRLLIDALPRDAVSWGRRVEAVEPVAAASATTQWRLKLSRSGSSTDQSQVAEERAEEEGPYDLVVGADGAWSRVRAHLTPARPLYSGIVALDLRVDNLDAHDGEEPDSLLLEEASAFVGPGSCFVLGEGRALLFQRHGDGSARCMAAVQETATAGAVPTGAELLGAEEEEEEVDWTRPANCARYLERHFGHFAPKARRAALAFIGGGEEEEKAGRERRCVAVLRPLWMLPVGLTWDSRAGVTLAGDAAHVMTPFAGRGVNVGMRDAMELGERLVAFAKEREGGGKGAASSGDEKTAWDAADEEALRRVLSDYEAEMFARSRADAELTERCMKASMGPDGARRLLETMLGYAD